MGKRFVQTEWSSLIPELAQYLQIDPQKPDNLRHSKLALEAIKKICKKYRYMFRSDLLYSEMNYMIENLSAHLLGNLINAVTLLSTPGYGIGDMQLLVSICNSALHIIESILAQEELPDFYEENLGQITQACIYLLGTEFPIMQSTAEDREAVFKMKGKVVRLVYQY